MHHHIDPVVELHSGTVLFPHPLADMENPLGTRPCVLATHSPVFLEALERQGESAHLAIHPVSSHSGQTFLLVFIQIRDVLGVTVANLAEPAVQACLEGGMGEESVTFHFNAKWGYPTLSLPVECPREHLRAWVTHGKKLKGFAYEQRLADLTRSVDWLKHHAVMLKAPTTKEVRHLSICGIISSRKD